MPQQAAPLSRGRVFLQQLKVHSKLVALSIVTVLLAIAWLACAVGGVWRSDLGTPSNPVLPFYYQLTASGFAILLSFTATIFIIMSMNGLAQLQKLDTTARRASEVVHDKIGGKVLKGMASTKLRKFTFGTVSLIFVGVFLALTSVMLVFWTITLSYQSDFVIQKTPLRNISTASVIAPVIFVQIMIGIITPIMIFLSIVPINAVLRFVTYDRVDIRRIMPKLLPFISFSEGEKNVYWVAINTYYFKIKDDYRQTIEQKHQRKWYHLCDTSKSTVIIFCMLSINFLLAWSAFVRGSLVSDFSARSCDELTNRQRERAACIIVGDIKKIGLANCSSQENTAINGSLLCFQFLRFHEQGDIFASITQAVIFYFITAKFISLLLEVTRFFYLFHKSRIWATFILFTGIVLIGVAAGMVIAFLVQLITTFSLNKIYELLIIGIDIVLVGVMLLISEPLELSSVKTQCLPENKCPVESGIELVPHSTNGSSQEKKDSLEGETANGGDSLDTNGQLNGTKRKAVSFEILPTAKEPKDSECITIHFAKVESIDSD